ncbi:hypothetical protein Leryth_013298 [Lithospermum erythrorhizon]|nr:hypothetical protein Leryth_013298 [Lithospermum erythrorhizon]
MENHLVSQNRSRDLQTSARDRHTRLGYRLKYESTNVTRSGMVTDGNPFPTRSSEVLQKQQDNGKGHRNEELVRYMSSLPSFLKKEVKLNEKAFSVGVLDWQLLEKWQHFHNINNQHSSSSSNVSPFSSTGGSSSQSCRDRSLSPSPQKHPYPTLQSHIYGTPLENCSHDTESSVVNELKAQDRKALPSGLSGVQQSTLRTRLSSDQKEEYRLKDCKEKGLKAAKISIVRKSQSLEDIGEKMNIQDSESLRRRNKMRASFDRYTTDVVDARKQETSTYEVGNKYHQKCISSKLTDTKKVGSKKTSHLSFPSAGNFEESCTELSCNIPHSCSSHECDLSHPHIEEPCSDASQDKEISDDVFWRFSECGDVPANNYIGKNLQEEKSIPAVKDQVLINQPIASNTKMGSSGTARVRNPSPTRRFSFSLSRVGKVSGSSATSTVLQSGARNPLGSSGAEESGISSSSLNSSKENSKGRSSPLRRLLEPLMGPARASLSNSRSSEPATKSSEQYRKSTAHTVKVKLDLKTCKNDDAEVPHCSSKPSTVQALLQVAVRNGFPLFTFAVDNKNDILAATMRKSSSEKEEFSSMYSFFIVQEMKKHGGSWINNGRKDKGNSFVPNVVAQMKVTDAFNQNTRDQSISKQYVLFSYDTKQAETSDIELHDELAAVVVKIQKKSTSHWCQNWQGYENSVDSLASKLKQMHPLPSSKCNSGLGNVGENQTENQLTLTVLLPGGHHGQPIKGEPSSLVKRWKSGGSCDCGGWDLGCRMRVLTDNAQRPQRSSSAKPLHSPKLLELFSQDEGQDQKPVFSVAPFKDGIYAVEFNPSIEILQAFSISLSIMSCLKPVEFVETRNGLKETSSADTTVPETCVEKVYRKTQTEVPALVSNPPLSPAGRV